MPRSAGHEVGIRTLRKVADKCFERGIGVVSIYAFSTENWKRPKDEVDKLFGLLKRFFIKELKHMKQNGIRLAVMGDLSAFPADVREAVENALRETAHNTKYVLNIGLSYGGRAELVRAVQRLTAAGEAPTEAAISKYLDTAALPDPDLLVRTCEKRLSNFMLWQCAYTEIYFTDTPWPSFGEKALAKALEEYAARTRKFGALS
ncbi:isoprenyl transferase [Clostridia bacterium]|nr:isoprenyl transferase [Clostridia bacterium]